MVQIAHRLRGNLGRGETVVVAQCFQPAVSRISNPQAWEQFERSNHVERLPTGSRRYSRLETYATFGCGFAALRSSCLCGWCENPVFFASLPHCVMWFFCSFFQDGLWAKGAYVYAFDSFWLHPDASIDILVL